MHPTDPIFHNEEHAIRYLEQHVWPDGPRCPHCDENRRIGKLKGDSTRIGTYKCYQCRKPFTVKIGTLFERSHLPLHVWLKTIFLLSTSKEPINIPRLHLLLEISPKAATSMVGRLAKRVGIYHSSGVKALTGAEESSDDVRPST